MANYKPGFREILDLIDGFYLNERDIAESPDVYLDDSNQNIRFGVLVSKISDICTGVLGIDHQNECNNYTKTYTLDDYQKMMESMGGVSTIAFGE